MTSPKRDSHSSHVDEDLTTHAEKLRELNNRLLAVAEQFVGKIPDSLEDLNRLLEQEFGPEAWKKIYEQIPDKADDTEQETLEPTQVKEPNKK
jgi:hypothetical protein